MARKVFFSFHYERDIKRVGQIRNCGLTKPDLESAGFIDAASWESIKKQGVEAIKRWIAQQLDGTSVTVVLIGAETSQREWVIYEIKESYKKGNALLGIYIHNVVDLDKKTDVKGQNPFDQFYIKRDGSEICLSQICKTYDWVNDGGYDNFGKWVEEAFKNREGWGDDELIESTGENQDIRVKSTFTSLNPGHNREFTPRSPWSGNNADIE